MIQIYVASTLLDMPEKYNITFSLLNPAFSNDAFPRIFSTNFKLPRSHRNENVFDFGTRFDSDSLGEKYFASISIEGAPFKHGYLKMEDYDDDNMELYFVSDALYASDLYAEQKIRDLVNESFSVPGDIDHFYNIRLAQTSGVYHWKITIGNKVFEKIYGSAVFTTDVANDIVAAISPYYNINVVSTPAPTRINIDLAGEDYPKVEFEDFNTGLFILLENNTVHGAIYIRNLWNAYLNANIEAGNADVRFPVIRNDNFYDGKNERWFGYVNHHSVTHKTNTASSEGTGFQYNLCPQIRNGLIIEKIAAAFNFTPDGLYNDPDFQKLFIYNTVAIDRLEWEEPDRFSVSPTLDLVLNSYQHTFDFKDHIPDLTAKEYLLSLSSFLNLFYIYRDGLLKIISRSDVLESSPLNWTNKVSYRNYNVSTAADGAYRISFEEAKNDDYSNDNLTQEAGSSSFETPTIIPRPVFHTDDLGDVPIAGQNDREWKILMANGKGNSEFEVGLDNDYGFRLFLYHGLVNDELGSTITSIRPYPFGSSDSADVSGNSLGGLKLDLSTKDESIFSKYWERWLEFKKNHKEVTLVGALNLVDILTLDWEQPMRYINHSNGSLTFIISKINFSVNQCGISSSKIEGYSK